MKKAVTTIVNAISTAIILLSVLILLSVVFTKSGEAPSFLGYSSFRVLTGSMEPTIPVDSLILVRKTDPADIREGDVISFYSTEEQISGFVNTHRVVSIREEGGERWFFTKGDANPFADDEEVNERSVIGVVKGKSLLVGKIVRLLSNPLIFFPAIAIPLLGILLLNAFQVAKSVKEISEEEKNGQ